MIDAVYNDKCGAVIVHDTERLDEVRCARMRLSNRLLFVRKNDELQHLLTLNEQLASQFADCTTLRIIRMKHYAVARDFVVPLLVED